MRGCLDYSPSYGCMVPCPYHLNETQTTIVHLTDLSFWWLSTAQDYSNSLELEGRLIQCKPDISRSRISRNWIYRGRMLDPIFWRPRARYFFFPWTQFAGDNFSRNLLTAIAFVPGSQETIFREINSSLPVNTGWNTCCATLSHVRRSIDTSIVS